MILNFCLVNDLYPFRQNSVGVTTSFIPTEFITWSRVTTCVAATDFITWGVG